jgi:hypothetical protein
MAKQPQTQQMEFGGEKFTVCYLDPGYRPNTAGKEHVCCVCSKEIKRPERAGLIHCVKDEDRYEALNSKQSGGQFPDEMGCHEVGPECAKRFPGFVHPKIASTGAA